MTPFRIKTITALLSAALLGLASGSSQATVTGQWDFENGNLGATVGEDLHYYDWEGGETSMLTEFGTTAALGIPDIAGQPANVMKFPKASPSMGYQMFHGVEEDGILGAENYTLIFDLLFPPESDSQWRALIQIDDPFNGNDAELFVNPGNGIGIGGQYHGAVQPNTWHRIVFVKDGATLRKYIDGVRVGEQGVGGTRWVLDPAPWGYALIFTDNDNETAAGYVGSIQVRNVPLGDFDVAKLGGASASGIPQTIPDVEVAPSITLQPDSGVAPFGGEFTLTVAAVGTEPLSYQWRRNEEEIEGATSATLVLNPVEFTDAGLYDVMISNVAGTATSRTARVAVFSGPITEGLVTHLKFDNDTQDASGRGNHGTPVGQPEIGEVGPGFAGNGQQRIGSHALHIGAGQHVTLGRPSDLQFGSDVDFTISFWVKGEPGAWSSDPSFISNKNWASGSNQGFIIAAQGNGGWKGNFKGANAGRKDTPNIAVITTGEWRHVLVIFDRARSGSFYLDGELVSTIPIAGDGNVDALDINIGNDGTGRYGFDNDTGARFSDVYIDDLGIWRRALTPGEIQAIYSAGLEGVDLANSLSAGPSNITGQWDFDQGNLAATVGAALEYRGDTAALTEFREEIIDGSPAHVMCFPATTPEEGYIMMHGAGPNGGGNRVNQYTLIMDVMFPQESHGRWRSFFQTNPDNTDDGELFVNTGNGIGISGQYHGQIIPDTWHRVAFAFDLTEQTLGKYIDGVLVNLQTLGSGVDARWSLLPTALLFADENNETAPGCVASIQFRDVRLSDFEIATLGGPTADGISRTVSILLTPPEISVHPSSQLASQGETVTLNVRAAGTAPLQYQWRFNGQEIQGATGESLVLSNVQPAAAGGYDVIVSNDFGSDRSRVAELEVFAGGITDDLVLHLRFDNNANDSSGRNNHGTGVGQPEVGGEPPAFAGGGAQRIGTHALRIGEGQHVTLGRPDDLLFGSDVDFTVSFWVRGVDWSSDPALVANKNWASGGNQGWNISTQSGGTWKWNWKGANADRRDANGIGQIRDDTWHHILVSHHRGGLASFYHDGQLQSTMSIDGDGSVDALDINIGNDGTGRYGFDNDTGARFSEIYFDDLGIWRRALTEGEAAAIYQAGLAGNDLTTATTGAPGELTITEITLSAGSVTISWEGGPGVRLQKAASLLTPNWENVPDSEGASTFTEAIGNAAAFYRLSQ